MQHITLLLPLVCSGAIQLTWIARESFDLYDLLWEVSRPPGK